MRCTCDWQSTHCPLHFPNGTPQYHRQWQTIEDKLRARIALLEKVREAATDLADYHGHFCCYGENPSSSGHSRQCLAMAEALKAAEGKA